MRCAFRSAAQIKKNKLLFELDIEAEVREAFALLERSAECNEVVLAIVPRVHHGAVALDAQMLDRSLQRSVKFTIIIIMRCEPTVK